LLNDQKSCAKLTEVRGIANSKNLVLMHGLVCGRWNVRGHPKATETRRHGVTDKLLNKMFDVMLMYVHVFWYVHTLYSM